MKNIINVKTGKITKEKLTAAEVSEMNELKEKRIAEEKKVEDDAAKAAADKEASHALKASAKAKLIAGEPLTEAEADVIVL